MFDEKPEINTDGINIAIYTDSIRMAYAIGYYVILPSGQRVIGKYDATNCLEGST